MRRGDNCSKKSGRPRWEAATVSGGDREAAAAGAGTGTHPRCTRRHCEKAGIHRAIAWTPACPPGVLGKSAVHCESSRPGGERRRRGSEAWMPWIPRSACHVQKAA